MQCVTAYCAKVNRCSPKQENSAKEKKSDAKHPVYPGAAAKRTADVVRDGADPGVQNRQATLFVGRNLSGEEESRAKERTNSEVKLVRWGVFRHDGKVKSFHDVARMLWPIAKQAKENNPAVYW
jgi:hypothetical protein